MAGLGRATVGGKLLERFPELLLKEMCVLTEQNTSDLKDVIITDQDTEEEGYDKELKDRDEIAGLLSEAGAPICEKDGTFFLGDVTEPETGAGCRIDRAYCASKGAKTVGTFHTHPLGGTTPSLPDLQTSANEKEELFCVGGRIGDKRKVTCYAPGPRVTAWGGPVYNPLRGYYPKFDVPETGKIVFYREPPPPLASELNVEMTDETIVELLTAYEDYTKKELQEKIKEVRAGFEKGEIFEEFWENYEAEGEMDELETYSPKDLERLEKLKLDFLASDYYIRSATCPKK